MAKKISSSDLFNPDLFTKTKDDALVYLSVLKDIEKEHHDLLAVQGQLVKTAKKNDVSGLKQRESAIKKITIAEKELLQVEMAIEKTEAKLNLSSSEQVRKLAELRDSLNRKNKAQRDSIKIALEDSDAYKRLSRSVNEAQANFKRLSAQFGINSKQAKQAQIALDGVQKELLQIDDAARDGRRTVGRYGTAFSGLGNGLKSIGGRFLAVTALIYAVGRALVSSFKTFRDFQQGAANLASVLGKSRSEIKALTDDAKRLGATTAFTASQVTKMQVSFAKLGFNEDEILNATEATLQLAAATGTDLDEAATVAASNLNAFGLGAEQTQRVVDLMAKSFSSSALDMSKFSTAMAIVGPVAKTAGLSIEQTTAAVGTLVDAGVDASTAGTGLRNIFLDLAKSGMTFEEAMQEIQQSTNKNATAMDLFGKRGATVATVLADNTDKTKELTKEFNNAGGAAQKMADEQLDTLSGSVTKLSSAWEGFILSLEDGDGVIAKTLRGAIDLATDFLTVMSKIAMSNKQLSEMTNRETSNTFTDIGKSGVDNLKKMLELSDSSLKSEEKRSALTEKILKLREAGISKEEAFLILSTENVVQSQTDLDNALMKKSNFIDAEIAKENELRKMLGQKGTAARAAGALEESIGSPSIEYDIAAAKGLKDVYKETLELTVRQKTNEEIIASLANEKLFAASENGFILKAILSAELQRRQDVGDVIDENNEKESKGNSKREKSAYELAKVKDNQIEKQDLLNEDIAAQLELEKQINEELRISGGLETATTEKLRAQSAELQNQIDIRRAERATGGPLTDVVGTGKTNDELLADYQKYLDDKKKTEDDAKKEEEEKAKEAAEKERELFNERLSAATAFYNQLNQLSNERIEKQLANIDKEIEASKERQNQLEAIAAQGQLEAQQSVKSEIKRQAELENEKAQLELKKQRMEALSSGFNLLAANLEKGATGDDAVVQTFRQMTNLIALISNLPGFYVGTDNAPEGLAWTDEKGAEIHLDKDGNIKDFGSNAGPQLKYLTKGDKILTAGESNIVKRQLNMQPALEAKERKSAVAMNDARIVQAVQSVVQAVNDKPVQEFDYDKIQQAVIDSIKGNGEINRKHISNKPKF